MYLGYNLQATSPNTMQNKRREKIYMISTLKPKLLFFPETGFDVQT
jgi:hypothetical protein